MTAPSLTYVVDTGEAEGAVANISGKRVKELLSDAFTFVRSIEANKAFGAMTLEELMEDQIKRNGESNSSNSSQYNPYTYDPNDVPVASEEPAEVANFLGGADTGQPTKIERILALKNEISSTVDALKEIEPVDLVDAEEYTEEVMEMQPEEE